MELDLEKKMREIEMIRASEIVITNSVRSSRLSQGKYTSLTSQIPLTNESHSKSWGSQEVTLKMLKSVELYQVSSALLMHVEHSSEGQAGKPKEPLLEIDADILEEEILEKRKKTLSPVEEEYEKVE